MQLKRARQTELGPWYGLTTARDRQIAGSGLARDSRRSRWDRLRHAGYPQAATAIAHILRFLEELPRIDHAPRFQVILKHPPVLDRPGKDVLAEEIDGEVLIPRGRDVLFHRQRLIAVGNDRELVLAVVNEVVIRRRGAEGLAIAKDHGAGRIGVDHVTAL